MSLGADRDQADAAGDEALKGFDVSAIPGKSVECTILDFSGSMKGSLADRFEAEAKKRGITLAELAADIIETVARDDLFAAILDD